MISEVGDNGGQGKMRQFDGVSGGRGVPMPLDADNSSSTSGC